MAVHLTQPISHGAVKSNWANFDVENDYGYCATIQWHAIYSCAVVATRV